jgi:hypothetical protein
MEEQNMEIEEIVEGSLSFTCLPDHIWEKTFSYSLNLGNLMLTCKYFNDLISKSEKLMSKMTLVLDASKYNDEKNIASIFKSERKVSDVRVRNIVVFGFKFFKILDHFKKSIKKIRFDTDMIYDPRPGNNSINWSSVFLIDLFEMLQNLEELYIDSRVKFLCDNQPLLINFTKGRKLKKVHIGDATILQYMPEIEDLSCRTYSELSTCELKKYLETQPQLKKLEVSLFSSDKFPAISTDIKIKLSSFTLDGGYETDSLLSNHAIDFIKSQAKSLKHLEVDDFTFNLDIIQDLFDGMKELKTVTISGNLKSQLTEFVERNFECSKVEGLSFDVGNFEYPRFFRKFPKLKWLQYWEIISGPMVDSLAQNCRHISDVTFVEFNEAYQNATFPELVELLIFRLADGFESDFETFIARQTKLRILDVSFVMNKKTLWKLPTLLPNLIELRFQSYQEFDEADLKKLLLSWESIKKLVIVTEDERELDLEAATRGIPREVVVLQDWY